MKKGIWQPIGTSIVLLLGSVLAIDLAVRPIAEGLWFQKLGYFQTFLVRILTQGAIWTVVLGFTFAFLAGNLWLTRRFKYPRDWKDLKRDAVWLSPDDRRFLPLTPPLEIFALIAACLGCGMGIACILWHSGASAAALWHPDYTDPSLLPSLPPRLTFRWIGQQFATLPQQPLRLGIPIAFSIALLFVPELGMWVSAVLLSLGFGMILSTHWMQVLQFFQPTFFNTVDPIFQRDLSFYTFSLPLGELLEVWLFSTVVFALFAVALTYILSGNALSEGRFPGFARPQKRHIQGLFGGVMLAVAFRYALERYELLYSSNGVIYGGSYTDVMVRLNANTILSLLAVAIALMLFLRAIFAIPPAEKSPKRRFSQVIPPAETLAVYFITAVTASWLVPEAVQRIAVQPNELAFERPYIQRSIEFTRNGFNLSAIEAKTFDPSGELKPADLKANALTLDNIRLWDTRPLLETNRQLQQIRLYYRFPSAHLDRYTLKRQPTPNNPQRVESRQAIVAARELDYSAVPEQAQTWINQHLVYTHGFGFTMSPVNTVAPSGLPEYFVRGIGAKVQTGEGSKSPIEVADPKIRASIPLGYPRIYYGELTNAHIMTPTNTLEFDYPQGDDNAYNTYDGRGGIHLGTGWRRVIFAIYLRDWRMLFTNNFTPETKILFRRNIADRIRHIAPFLRYDRPYLTVADANLDRPGEPEESHNYLYWTIDAYTTSDRYPYSDPGPHSFNYIRNSVKVVVDAYNGTVKFYVADPTDPIVATYQKIFPNLFAPIEQLPKSLRVHLRYPVDFFNVQAERLLTYHMTDPQVFYNREDQWQIPTEIYRDESQLIEPYYLIMKLPTATTEEFILLSPITPTKRNNLIAWLAGRSDGQNYGKLLLYQFPKQELVFGPEQIEARINQQPQISEQFSLWDQQGSRVIKGNLLVIPIEQSLLYVEPIYLEAEENSLPTLVRVVLAYKDMIVMAPTLNEAIEAIFNPKKQPNPRVIRSTDEVIPNVDVTPQSEQAS